MSSFNPSFIVFLTILSIISSTVFYFGTSSFPLFQSLYNFWASPLCSTIKTRNAITKFPISIHLRVRAKQKPQYILVVSTAESQPEAEKAEESLEEDAHDTPVHHEASKDVVPWSVVTV